MHSSSISIRRPLGRLLAFASLFTLLVGPAARAQSDNASPPSTTQAPRETARSAVDRTPQVYGFIQTHFRYAFATGTDGVVDPSDFRVQRARVGIEGRLRPWLSYQVEIDPRAPEVRGLMRDAFVSLNVIPRHRIRIGQQKTQFGYENRESSSDLFVVNRSELSDALSRGPNLRDVGIGLLGNVKMGKGWRFEDAITVVNGDGLNVQADSTPRKNVWGRAGLRYRKDSADFTARVGVSAASGDRIAEGLDPIAMTDDYRETFSRLGTDVEIDHRRFLFTAEYVRGSNTDTRTGESDDPNGYYVHLVGKTRWEVGPLMRLDTFADDFRRWTLGGYYGRPSAPFRVLVNYERRVVKDGMRGDDKFYVWTQVRF